MTPPESKSIGRRLLIEAVWFFSIVICGVAMWQSVLPVLQSSQNKFPDEQEIKSFNMPLSYEEHVGETIVMLKLKLGKIRFNNYEFIQDDCLE